MNKKTSVKDLYILFGICFFYDAVVLTPNYFTPIPAIIVALFILKEPKLIHRALGVSFILFLSVNTFLGVQSNNLVLEKVHRMKAEHEKKILDQQTAHQVQQSIGAN